MVRPSILALVLCACGGGTHETASREPVTPAASEPAERSAIQTPPPDDRQLQPELLHEAIDQLAHLFMAAVTHHMATDRCIIGPVRGADADDTLRSQLGWERATDGHFRYEVATPHGPTCGVQAGLPPGEVYVFQAIATGDVGTRVVLDVGSDDEGMLYRSEYRVVFASGEEVRVDSSGEPVE